jgi:hypothetical protein
MPRSRKCIPPSGEGKGQPGKSTDRKQQGTRKRLDKGNIRKVPASGDVKWWRVPITCYGVEKDAASVNFPLFEGKPPRTNIVMMLKKSDMPTGLAEIIHNRMEFEAEVPTWALHAHEISFRNFTWSDNGNKPEVPRVGIGDQKGNEEALQRDREAPSGDKAVVVGDRCLPEAVLAPRSEDGA